ALRVPWDGQLERPRFTIQSERNGSWTLSGLQGDTAVLDGSSDFHLAVETQPLFGPATRSYDLAYTADYDGIAYDIGAERITAGSAHLAVAAERTESGNGQDSQLAFDVDAVVT